MRRLLPVSALLLAACASTPPPVPTPKPTPRPAPEVRTGVSGLSQPELIQRFGNPSFQVREGTGLKLQWQNLTCVLDTYLYPPASGNGAATVVHADARRPGTGDTVPVESCIVSLSPPRP